MAAYVAQSVSIHPRAQIDDDVQIGPFCVIGPDVRIGRGTRLESNVTIMGRVTIGQFNHFYPGAVIGGEPQDLTYTGADTKVVIGDHNTFRECVTVNRASEKEEGSTSIGALANATLLGGHVHVHDRASISGSVAVHQYTTVGSFSFVAGLSGVRHDVPPYMLVEGVPARPRCINVVALKRNDFSPDTIDALAEAHRLLFRAKVGLAGAREILRSKGLLVPHVNHLLGFLDDQQVGRHGRGRDRRRAA